MTEKLFYSDSHLYSCCAMILSCTEEENGFAVETDRTVFFPGGGGQDADEGTIDGKPVLQVKEKDGIILHYLSEVIPVGQKAELNIDENIRFQRMQNHSGEHIFSGLVHTLFGFDNVGFHMDKDCMTVDFNGILSAEDIRLTETKANAYIWSNRPVRCFFPTADELCALTYRSKKELDGAVRIVEMEGIDRCACCAPHVNTTGEIGLLKVVDFIKHRGGTRLTVLCGKTALQDYFLRFDTDKKLSALLSAPVQEHPECVQRLQNELKSVKSELSGCKKEIIRTKCDSLSHTDENIILFFDDTEIPDLREIAKQCLPKTEKAVCICSGNDTDGYRFVLASEKINLYTVAEQIKKQIPMRGGGSETMMQGSFLCVSATILKVFSKTD